MRHPTTRAGILAVLTCALAQSATGQDFQQFQEPFAFEGILPSEVFVPLPPRDIQIEDFGYFMPADSTYPLPADDVTLHFDLTTSVNFTAGGKPSFDATVSVVAFDFIVDEDPNDGVHVIPHRLAVSTFELVTERIPATSVRYRGLFGEFQTHPFSAPLNTPAFRAWVSDQLGVANVDGFYVRLEVDSNSEVWEGGGFPEETTNNQNDNTFLFQNPPANPPLFPRVRPPHRRPRLWARVGGAVHGAGRGAGPLRLR
jgi:hypothetical protein